MLPHLIRLMFRCAFPCILFAAVLAVPLWLLRTANPASWYVIQDAAGFDAQLTGWLGGAEDRMFGHGYLLFMVIAVHAFVPWFALASLERTPLRLADLFGIMVPRLFFYPCILWVTAASAALCCGALASVWGGPAFPPDWLLFVGPALVAHLFALVLVEFAGTARMNIPLDGPSVSMDGTRAWHQVHKAFVLLPLAYAFLTVQVFIGDILDGRLLAGLGPEAAYAVLGAIEVGVLVVWALASAAAWHQRHGSEVTYQREELAETFA